MYILIDYRSFYTYQKQLFLPFPYSSTIIKIINFDYIIFSSKLLWFHCIAILFEFCSIFFAHIFFDCNSWTNSKSCFLLLTTFKKFTPNYFSLTLTCTYSFGGECTYIQCMILLTCVNTASLTALSHFCPALFMRTKV